MKKLTAIFMTLLVLASAAGCRAVIDKDPESAACTYHWLPTAKVPGTKQKVSILVKAFMEPEGKAVVFQGRIIRYDGSTLYIDKDGRTSKTFLELNLTRVTTFPVVVTANAKFDVKVDVVAMSHDITQVRCDIVDTKAL
jgi:hypothetical protein